MIAGLSLRTWSFVLALQGVGLGFMVTTYGTDQLLRSGESNSAARSLGLLAAAQWIAIAALIKIRLRDARTFSGRDRVLSALLYVVLSTLVLAVAAWLWSIPWNASLLGCWGLALGLLGVGWVAAISLPISRWGACLTADPPDADRSRNLIILYLSIVYFGILMQSALTSIPVAQAIPPGMQDRSNSFAMIMILLLYQFMQGDFHLAARWKSDGLLWGILVAMSFLHSLAIWAFANGNLPSLLIEVAISAFMGAILLVVFRRLPLTSPRVTTAAEKGKLS